MLRHLCKNTPTQYIVRYQQQARMNVDGLLPLLVRRIHQAGQVLSASFIGCNKGIHQSAQSGELAIDAVKPQRVIHKFIQRRANRKLPLIGPKLVGYALRSFHQFFFSKGDHLFAPVYQPAISVEPVCSSKPAGVLDMAFGGEFQCVA